MLLSTLIFLGLTMNIKKEYENRVFVQYVRVSTEDQLNGIEAQKKQLDDFVKRHNGITLQIFEEYKSGADNKRKGLAEAIDLAQKEKAILLVSKLDRLARNAKFILEIREKNIDRGVAENPEMGTLMLGRLASFAEEERRLISERTKAGLQVVKASGKKIGGNHWKEVPQNVIQGNKDRAAKRREELRNFVLEWKDFIGGDANKLLTLLDKQGYKNYQKKSYNLRSLKKLGILEFLKKN